VLGQPGKPNPAHGCGEHPITLLNAVLKAHHVGELLCDQKPETSKAVCETGRRAIEAIGSELAGSDHLLWDSARLPRPPCHPKKMRA
jgi:hypothetical protein